jgi:hypothetical protein
MLTTLTGLSTVAAVEGAPPGPIPPTQDFVELESSSEGWTAVLTTIVVGVTSFTINVSESLPLGLEVRDNEYYDSVLGWQPSLGNVGVEIGGDGGPLTVTVAELEAAINATSQLLRVTTNDVVNAALVVAEQVPKAGPIDFSQAVDRSAIDQARDSMMWNTATGKFLTELGANYGIPRPPQSPFDDELYRRVGQVLGWLPKTPLLVTVRLAEAIFGTQQANEIIFECPIDAIAGDTSTAGYMHGYPGHTEAVVGLTATITFVGPDARLSVSGSNLNGRSLYLFHTSAWQTYTISSASYDSTTELNTIVLNAATVPTGNNYRFFIDVPGVNSWNPGDFMEDDASIEAGGLNPPSSHLVYLFGKGKLDIFEFYMNNFVRAAGVTLRTEVL